MYQYNIINLISISDMRITVVFARISRYCACMLNLHVHDAGLLQVYTVNYYYNLYT